MVSTSNKLINKQQTICLSNKLICCFSKTHSLNRFTIINGSSSERFAPVTNVSNALCLVIFLWCLLPICYVTLYYCLELWTQVAFFAFLKSIYRFSQQSTTGNALNTLYSEQVLLWFIGCRLTNLSFQWETRSQNAL